jgi:hypothetical protein
MELLKGFIRRRTDKEVQQPKPIFAEDFVGTGSLTQPYEYLKATDESPERNFARLLTLVLTTSHKGFQTPDFYFKVNSSTFLVNCNKTLVTLVSDQSGIDMGPLLTPKLNNVLTNTLMPS